MRVQLIIKLTEVTLGARYLSLTPTLKSKRALLTNRKKIIYGWKNYGFIFLFLFIGVNHVTLFLISTIIFLYLLLFFC